MLVRAIAVPTGRDAIRLEKELHLMLRQLHPHAVLDRSVFAGQVKVVSELYDAEIEHEIMELLDALEARLKALAARRARAADDAKDKADASRKRRGGTRSARRRGRKRRR